MTQPKVDKLLKQAINKDGDYQLDGGIMRVRTMKASNKLVEAFDKEFGADIEIQIHKDRLLSFITKVRREGYQKAKNERLYDWIDFLNSLNGIIIEELDQLKYKLKGKK